MASKYSSNTISPIVSFISFLSLGIILGVYVNKNEEYVLFYILAGIIIGGLIAGFELRSLVKKPLEITEMRPLTAEEKQNKLSRFVADLFDEDIPVDEIEKKKNQETYEIDGTLTKHQDVINDEEQ